MNFSEWFNPHNIEHIKAYKHLEETGFWPNGFGASYHKEPHWQILIVNKIASAWVAKILDEKAKN